MTAFKVMSNCIRNVTLYPYSSN